MSEEQTQLGWKGHIVVWKTNILGRIPNVVSSVTTYNISMVAPFLWKYLHKIGGTSTRVGLLPHE